MLGIDEGPLKARVSEDSHDILRTKLTESSAELHLALGQCLLNVIDSHEIAAVTPPAPCDPDNQDGDASTACPSSPCRAGRQTAEWSRTALVDVFEDRLVPTCSLLPHWRAGCAATPHAPSYAAFSKVDRASCPESCPPPQQE